MLPKLVRPKRYTDARGWFAESYNVARMAEIGVSEQFVQDNHSFSARRLTLRGLHFQISPNVQAKLVRCVTGSIFDVAVDCRTGSPTRGHWVSATLTASGGEQLYIPGGFAHGFLTLTDDVNVLYKASSYYAPTSERVVRWDDEALAIDWPTGGDAPLLAARDAQAPQWGGVDADFPYLGGPLGELEDITL